MLGLVVGAGDATVNKKLLPSGEIDKQVGNYDIVWIRKLESKVWS